jgi:hypothetical protein
LHKLNPEAKEKLETYIKEEFKFDVFIENLRNSRVTIDLLKEQIKFAHHCY